MPKRLLIIGAGPIGLEAALLGCGEGFEVTVLEKDRVGASLLRIGSTRFFSPFAMNVSARAREVLGNDAPSAGALLSGEEMVRRVLLPLVERAPLAGRIHLGRRVIGVGRARMSRTEMPGHPIRAARPFKILAEDERKEETVFEAEHVLDASGVSCRPQRLGAGGLFAKGERRFDGRIVRHLGALEAALPTLENQRVLLVGHGHSAANAVAMLERARCASITWAVRTQNRRPCVEVASDPLPERKAVVARANALAENPPPHLRVERRAQVESVDESKDGALLVQMTGDRSSLFDRIVSMTGYAPDLSFLSELALEISPVTEGALRIHRALANVTDCLAVPRLGPSDLFSGEPGFHLAGVKSYGRLSSFLLKTGIDQLEQIFAAWKAAPR